MIKFLSPSALRSWEENPYEFAQTRLVEDRLPKRPQSKPMVAGSAFDAYVKAELYADLGIETKELLGCPTNELAPFLIKKQCESHVRAWARKAGKYIMKAYKATGFYDDLLERMAASPTTPELEVRVEKEINGVPMIGLPDGLYSMPNAGLRVIHDFKVRGFCSKYTTSPTPRYSVCVDGMKWNTKKGTSRSHGKTHKEYQNVQVGDYYGHAGGLDAIHETYATQLSTYNWCCGAEVGDDSTLYTIEELCCQPESKEFGPTCKLDMEERIFPVQNPLIRVAQYAGTISSEFQTSLMARYARMWGHLQDKHYFPDVTKAESDDIMEGLERSATTLMNMPEKERQHYLNSTRGQALTPRVAKTGSRKT